MYNLDNPNFFMSPDRRVYVYVGGNYIEVSPKLWYLRENNFSSPTKFNPVKIHFPFK